MSVIFQKRVHTNNGFARHPGQIRWRGKGGWGVLFTPTPTPYFLLTQRWRMGKGGGRGKRRSFGVLELCKGGREGVLELGFGY